MMPWFAFLKVDHKFWKPNKEGVNLTSLGLIILFGLSLWFVSPPTGLNLQAWHLCIIFIASIGAIILKPLPTPAVAMISLAVCLVTQTLSLEQGLSSFSSSIVWLIVFAFAIARGFGNTGLGKRISFYLVRIFGHSPLGLSYAVILSELFLSPMIPSNTARGAGVVFPLVESLAEQLGSHPKKGTQRLIGAFLIKVAFQGNLVVCSLFLTAIASNPLVVGFAADQGIYITWAGWFWATCVPGLVNVLLLPLAIYSIYPPQMTETRQAKRLAKDHLGLLGPFSFHEKVMMVVFAGLLVLWIGGNYFQIDPTTVALLGFCALLLTGVLKWKDVIEEKVAWETFIWFSILLMMATFLSKLGVMQWFSMHVQNALGHLPWMVVWGILSLIYFYSHYFFTSTTAHLSALYGSFLMIMLSFKVPPLIAALSLGVFTNLSAGLTHYGTGPAPVFFGAGYVSIQEWWRVGALISVVNLLIWGVVGGIWWKVIGLW